MTKMTFLMTKEENVLNMTKKIWYNDFNKMTEIL